jgi:phospholipid/cholesterol/gamma-HCH transport system substrate-binding protein
MSRKAEIQVGLTVLVALVILFLSLAWLKEFSFIGTRRTWHVIFPEAGGLSKSDEVLVNGVRKGEVKAFTLVGDHVEVDIDLSKEITLTHDCQVAIRNVGLMGEKVIGVDLKTTGVPYRPEERIPGVYERGLGEVMGQLSTTVDAVGALSVELKNVAAMIRDGKLTGTIQNFNRTSEELRLAVSENRAALHDAIGNFAEASKTAKTLTTDRETQLKQTFDNFASAAEKMDQLSGRLDSLRMVLQNVSGRVARGEGTLGKLVQDDRLYAELNESVRSFKVLIEDIKAHPRKYLKFSVF